MANTLNVLYNGRDCYGVHNRDNRSIPLRIDYVPGQEVWNVRDRIACRLSDGLRITGRLGYYRREMIRNAAESEHSRYYDYSGGVRADWEPTAADHVEVSYNFDQYDKSRYYVPSALLVSDMDVREYSNVQNSVRSLWNRNFSQGTLTLGADYMYDYLVNAKLADADYHQSSADAFVQYDWNLSKQWELIGALRYDYFESGHRSQLPPKVSAAWHQSRRLHLRAGYGMGFRAPTLKEQRTKAAFELMKSNLAQLGDSIDRAEYITSLDRGGLYHTELWRVVCERKTADGKKIVVERLFYVTTAELDGKLQVLGFRFDPLV
ncbi:MAG: TonB-dependent receptor [Victivallaceae bacterium]|nr:TonB-dependent receptor [Victivallaceae bacterium]